MPESEGNIMSKTLKLVISALMASMVCVATIVIKIPIPATGGYINLGDCIVLLSGVVLGPLYGGLAAGLGSALADLLGGYVVFAQKHNKSMKNNQNFPIFRIFLAFFQKKTEFRRCFYIFVKFFKQIFSFTYLSINFFNSLSHTVAVFSKLFCMLTRLSCFCFINWIKG